MNKNFFERTEKNPCEGCPAPCCRMQIHPCIPPTNLMSVDHIWYSLQFPGNELTIAINGQFQWVVWKTCALLDTTKATCTVHSTPRQPLTCQHYNPYNCWYKRCFVTAGEEPKELCRMNLARFEKWMARLEFDKDDNLIAAPDFKETQALIQ